LLTPIAVLFTVTKSLLINVQIIFLNLTFITNLLSHFPQKFFLFLYRTSHEKQEAAAVLIFHIFFLVKRDENESF